MHHTFLEQTQHTHKTQNSGVHGYIGSTHIYVCMVDATEIQMLYLSAAQLKWFSLSVKSVRGSAKLCYVVSFLQLYAKIHTAQAFKCPNSIFKPCKKGTKKEVAKKQMKKKDRKENLAGFNQHGFRRQISGYSLRLMALNFLCWYPVFFKLTTFMLKKSSLPRNVILGSVKIPHNNI